MDWTSVLQNLGAFLIGSGILGYLAKTLFKYYLDRSIEKYRLQLDRENEVYRHQLQLITQEHQIRYSKLHNDRADVIRTLFHKLVTMEQAMRSYMSPVQLAGASSRDEKQKTAGNAAQDFFDYFHPNEIFFDEKVCTLVEEMDTLYMDAWVEFTTYDDTPAREAAAADRDFRKERAEVWKAAWDTIDKKIPPVKEKLQNEFRSLLGVTKTDMVERTAPNTQNHDAHTSVEKA